MKTRTIVKILSLLLVLTTLCGMLVVPAMAASTAGFDILSTSIYAKVYTLASSGRTTPYTSKYLTTRGSVTNGASNGAYIDNAADELYVFDVGCTNGQWWAYVSYPTSTRRLNAYISLSAISTNNGNHAKTVSTGKFYCSKRATTSNSNSYYVDKGDTVYLLSTGSKYQIMYPISGGKWRIAFCDASDYQKYCGKPQPVANGTYTIVSALNNSKVLDISGGSKSNSANVQLYTNNGTQAQQFTLTYDPAGGYYTIKNVGSGLVLDVAGGKAAAGTNVQQYQSNSSAAQRWYLESAGNGYFYLRSALGYYLDVSGGSSKDGANIQTWSGNKSNAQKFKFVAKTTSSQATTTNWDSKVGTTVASIRSNDAYTKWYNSTGNVSAAGGYDGQCTWYAYGRFYEVNGIQLGSAPHAKYWLSQNSGNSKVHVLYGASAIRAKAIAVRTTGTYGHVMFIEYVTYNANGSPAYVYFTECNTDNNGTYDAGKDCVLQKMTYEEFVSKKNPAGFIIPA